MAGTLDVERVLASLWRNEELPLARVQALCEAAVSRLVEEPNVLKLDLPLSVRAAGRGRRFDSAVYPMLHRDGLPGAAQVVGDIHGQFYDLLKLFRVAGLPPERRFLFLGARSAPARRPALTGRGAGDFVDRGYFSLSTLLLLLALKVRHPDSVFLLRGNHEGRQITQVCVHAPASRAWAVTSLRASERARYGFYDECLRRYGTADAWLACTRVFEVLPVAATLGGRAFAVHGGLSPAVTTAAAIDGLSRRRELPSAGALCDLVWSDPDPGVSGWSVSPRGAGFLFGPDVADRVSRARRGRREAPALIPPTPPPPP